MRSYLVEGIPGKQERQCDFPNCFTNYLSPLIIFHVRSIQPDRRIILDGLRRERFQANPNIALFNTCRAFLVKCENGYATNNVITVSIL